MLTDRVKRARRAAVAASLAGLVGSGVARAADPAVAALQAVVRAEERVLESAEADRRAYLARQQAAASELARASETLAALLGRAAGGDEPAGLADAIALQLAAERAVVALAQESPAIHARVAASQARLAELRGSAAAAEEAAPRPGPLEGRWEIAYAPGSTSGWMRLSHQGTFVTGEDALLDGRRGSLTGTFAGGRLDLSRVDAQLGRDVVLAGALTPSGELEGTWHAVVLGRGRGEVGTFRARKTAAAPPAPDEP